MKKAELVNGSNIPKKLEIHCNTTLNNLKKETDLPQECHAGGRKRNYSTAFPYAELYRNATRSSRF